MECVWVLTVAMVMVARTERQLRTVECVWVLTVAMVMLLGQKGDPGLQSVSGF